GYRQNEAGRDRYAFLPADEERSTLSAHFGDRWRFWGRGRDKSTWTAYELNRAPSSRSSLSHMKRYAPPGLKARYKTTQRLYTQFPPTSSSGTSSRLRSQSFVVCESEWFAICCVFSPEPPLNAPNRIRPDLTPRKCFLSSSAIRTEHLRRNNRDALGFASLPVRNSVTISVLTGWSTSYSEPYVREAKENRIDTHHSILDTQG